MFDKTIQKGKNLIKTIKGTFTRCEVYENLGLIAFFYEDKEDSRVHPTFTLKVID